MSTVCACVCLAPRNGSIGCQVKKCCQYSARGQFSNQRVCVSLPRVVVVVGRKQVQGIKGNEKRSVPARITKPHIHARVASDCCEDCWADTEHRGKQHTPPTRIDNNIQAFHVVDRRRRCRRRRCCSVPGAHVQLQKW